MARQVPSRLQNRGVDQIVGECSSPPCWLHEVEPHYLGLWTHGEVIVFLRSLLHMELAALADVETSPPNSSLSDAMPGVQLNHAACCAILRKLISAQGENSLHRKFRPTHRHREQRPPNHTVSIARQHQAALAKTIEKALLKIDDKEIRDALTAMRRAHLDQFNELALLAG